MKIQGKTAIITGASRGIGKAIAIELANQGIKRLLLIARDRSRLAEVAEEIRQLGVETITFALDLTQLVEVNVAIARAWKTYGPIHLLVNCAGIAYQAPFLESNLEKVYQEMSLNVMGMYAVTRLVAKRMVTQGEGTIVNVSSLMGKVAAPTMSTYSATKFAILGFSRALRSELAPHNIRVVALLPSLTNTDMSKKLQLFRGIRPMTPEQVAKALIVGLNKDSSEILVGWQSHLAVWCQRLAPWLLEKIMLLASPLSRVSDKTAARLRVS